jgi:hypothetical protein
MAKNSGHLRPGAMTLVTSALSTDA